MSSTKVVHLKSFSKFITSQFGGAVLRKVMDAVSPEDRAVIESVSLTSSWIDYNVWWRLLLTADKIAGRGDLELIREIGAFDARENLNGIYKIFIAMMRPDFLVARCSMIWQRYYDTGRLKAARVEPNASEVWLEDWPGLPLHHEKELVGWMKAALEMAGAKVTRMDHTTCLARGDDHCTFLGEWK